MTDLTPNHPAVEAAGKAWGESRPTGAATWDEMSERLQGIVRARMAAAFSAAFPHLTAATPENLARLRNTPAGKQLMAEGWEAACRKVIHMAWADSSDAKYLVDEGNPYRKDSDA